MRIARVLHESKSVPVLALEQNGAIYSAIALDQRWGTSFSPERLAGADDFHTRVVSLSCAGLDALDEELGRGSRPTEARVVPGSFSWLPPCDPDRCLYVQMGPYSADRRGEPSYWIGSARGFLGHEAAVPFPAGESQPIAEIGIAAVLGEDLRRATPAEVQRAIIGYTLLFDWTASNERLRHRDRGAPDLLARDFATQLGPVLVTKAGPQGVLDVSTLRCSARVGTAPVWSCPSVGAWTFSLAESISYVSDHIELHGGDVIGAGSLASVRVPYGTTVEFTVEQLGTLSGRPVEGPPPIKWRID